MGRRIIFLLLFTKKIENSTYKYIYLYNGFPNPSLYQRTILTRSVGDDGVILHGKLVNIPETDCIRVTGTGKETEKRVRSKARKEMLSCFMILGWPMWCHMKEVVENLGLDQVKVEKWFIMTISRWQFLFKNHN